MDVSLGSDFVLNSKMLLRLPVIRTSTEIILLFVYYLSLWLLMMLFGDFIRYIFFRTLDTPSASNMVR